MTTVSFNFVRFLTFCYNSEFADNLNTFRFVEWDRSRNNNILENFHNNLSPRSLCMILKPVNYPLITCDENTLNEVWTLIETYHATDDFIRVKIEDGVILLICKSINVANHLAGLAIEHSHLPTALGLQFMKLIPAKIFKKYLKVFCTLSRSIEDFEFFNAIFRENDIDTSRFRLNSTEVVPNGFKISFSVNPTSFRKIHDLSYVLRIRNEEINIQVEDNPYSILTRS